MLNFPASKGLTFVWVYLILISIHTSAFTSGYDLKSPSKVLILPEILREVSGLTDIDATTIACVQDEKGIIFIGELSIIENIESER